MPLHLLKARHPERLHAEKRKTTRKGKTFQQTKWVKNEPKEAAEPKPARVTSESEEGRSYSDWLALLDADLRTHGLTLTQAVRALSREKDEAQKITPAKLKAFSGLGKNLSDAELAQRRQALAQAMARRVKRLQLPGETLEAQPPAVVKPEPVAEPEKPQVPVFKRQPEPVLSPVAPVQPVPAVTARDLGELRGLPSKQFADLMVEVGRAKAGAVYGHAHGNLEVAERQGKHGKERAYLVHGAEGVKAYRSSREALGALRFRERQAAKPAAELTTPEPTLPVVVPVPQVPEPVQPVAPPPEPVAEPVAEPAGSKLATPEQIQRAKAVIGAAPNYKGLAEAIKWHGSLDKYLAGMTSAEIEGVIAKVQHVPYPDQPRKAPELPHFARERRAPPGEKIADIPAELTAQAAAAEAEQYGPPEERMMPFVPYVPPVIPEFAAGTREKSTEEIQSDLAMLQKYVAEKDWKRQAVAVNQQISVRHPQTGEVRATWGSSWKTPGRVAMAQGYRHPSGYAFALKFTDFVDPTRGLTYERPSKEMAEQHGWSRTKAVAHEILHPKTGQVIATINHGGSYAARGLAAELHAKVPALAELTDPDQVHRALNTPAMRNVLAEAHHRWENLANAAAREHYATEHAIAGAKVKGADETMPRPAVVAVQPENEPAEADESSYYPRLEFEDVPLPEGARVHATGAFAAVPTVERGKAGYRVVHRGGAYLASFATAGEAQSFMDELHKVRPELAKKAKLAPDDLVVSSLLHGFDESFVPIIKVAERVRQPGEWQASDQPATPWLRRYVFPAAKKK